MILEIDTSWAQKAGMPITHYALISIVHFLTDGGRVPCTVESLSHHGNIKQSDALSIILNYFDILSVQSDLIYFHKESSHLFETSGIESNDIADSVIRKFNEINGTRYSPVTYRKKIATILASDRRLTETSFESVMRFKRDDWGDDPKMSKFNRPATLFASVHRFRIYLEEARMYWDKKAKSETIV